MEHITMRPRGIARQTLAAIALFTLFAAIPLQARPRSKKKPKNKAFSYYMLVLSYAPDFCAQPKGDKDARECGIGHHAGFVVHGLWPQGETTRGPENCGSSRVSQDIIDATLSYTPTEKLIQHEWTAHGTCSGLTAEDYFTLLGKARDSVNIPDDLNQPDHQLQLNPADFGAKFASAKPELRERNIPHLLLSEQRAARSANLPEQGSFSARLRYQRRTMQSQERHNATCSLAHGMYELVQV